MTKPRKWSNLKGVVPDDPTQTELSERMKKVLAAKDTRQSMTMDQLAEEYAALEEEEAFEELIRSERNIKFDALDRRILEELDKVKALAGTDMWRGQGQTFSPQFKVRPVVVDRKALSDWIKTTGQEDQLTLPSMRLTAIVGEALNTDAAVTMSAAQRAALKPGEPASGAPPPGVTVFLQTVVHRTSVKKGAIGKLDDTE